MLIEARNLHRSYELGQKTIEVLHGIDLQIHKGEKVFLCGASGAGKTTLLYTLAGLECPIKGDVLIDGTSLYQLPKSAQAAIRNRRMGYIFQNYFLMPELTAVENAALPVTISGQDGTERARFLLEKVGLGHRLDHLPTELSGGEQQRVAIARALAMDPDILYADEPTGNLDSRNGGEVIEALMNLVDSFGKTLVVVTHDESLAAMGDRRLEIKDGTIAY